MTIAAIKEAFPGYETKIIPDFVEMLTFDALIGHNDRHPYNWGVIVPLRKSSPPRFSPVYDTARALYCTNPEKRIGQMLTNAVQFERYIKDCAPPVGWDSLPGVDFFTLIALIWQDFAVYRSNIERFLDDGALRGSVIILRKEFSQLMSAESCELLEQCLRLRQQRLKEVVRL